ncbi:MAG: hypothetical protein ABSB50_11160 [Terracidiphilus sp.]|jgi:hypothetical protein
MPTDVQVEKALELIQKSGGNYEYFFEKLSSPAWIEPLAKRGRFDHPPGIERIGNMYRFPPWPEGQYLLRMADVAPEEVAAVIKPACFASDNHIVHRLLVEIACKLPPPLARELAVQEAAWVREQLSLIPLYPEKAAALVAHLATGGEPGAALELASAILEVRAPKDTREGMPIEAEDGSTIDWRPAPDPEAKLEPVWSQLFLRKVNEPLLLAIPDGFLASLAENLNRAVTIHSSNQQDKSDDYSTIWRPHLEHSSHYEALNETVTALTGAIKFLSSQPGDHTEQILHALEPYTWPIFDRVRAFTLLHEANADADLVVRFLNEPTRYARASANPEFAELLKKQAPALPKEVLAEILERIDRGPDPASYAYHLEHRVRPENVELEKTVIIERWQLDWLHPLAAVLDETHARELDRLLEKYDAPRPRFRSGGVRQVQDHSPTDLDSFRGMSTEALVKYLKDWTPPSTGLPFEQPSRAGVANTLREWVADDPQHASEVLDSFLTTELDPAYITALLDAFAGALKTEKPFDLYDVAKAAQWVAENTDALMEVKDDGWNREATWNWAHMSAARFLSDLFLEEKRLDLARAAELFPPARAVCFLPRPTAEDEAEYKKEPSRYASFALNTPRPVGVEALIRYGRWIKLATPEAEFTPALLSPVFEVLEQKLDAAQETSAAVREMFGMQFRTLGWLGLEWFLSVIPKLFPGKDGTKEEKTLDRFAWNSYLQYCGPVGETLPATRKRYLMAIKTLQKGDAPIGENDRTLASHLMQYYGHGVIELDDELLVQFFSSASIKLRAQAVGDIGWNLIQEGAFLSPEMQARYMRLWESRMELLKTGSKEEADELATFGWWLACGKFPDEWAIEQALPILERVRSLRPDFAVVEALDRLSSKYPYEAIRVVHVLFEEDLDGWAIHGWDQHLDSILKAALSDGEMARKEAAEMIELLVARGFRGYRNLRPENGNET